MEVTISNYGKGRRPQANTIAVQVGTIQYFFSYRTCVAFYSPGTGLARD